MSDHAKNRMIYFAGIVLICLVSFAFTLIMVRTGSYPHGSHVYGHLYKAELLYEQIKNMGAYPVYNKNWYSGMEIFRYWPPGAYYFYAFIMLFTGGSVNGAYIIFTFLTHVISGCGFMLFAGRSERPRLCMLLGVLYIILPENQRIFFSEGNLPIVFVTMLLPWLVYYVWEFIAFKSGEAIAGIDLISMLIAASHMMSAAVCFVALFVFLLIFSIVTKTAKNQLVLLGSVVLSYLSMGIFLVPYLTGSVMGEGVKASRYTFENVWARVASESLNPLLLPGNPLDFYFGLSVFVVMAVSLIVWRRENLPFTLTAGFIFLGTTTILMPVITSMPFSQVFWMVRYVPLAYVMIFAGLIFWKKVKRSTLTFFLVFMFLDCIFTFAVHTGGENDYFPSEEEIRREYMLDKAMKYTENRMACLDLTNIGSYVSYVITQDGRDVDSLFGWDYPGAYTAPEIMELNEALENGYYDYVLDRLIRYGCDTLVVKKDEIKVDLQGFLKKAEEFGYRIADETKQGILLDFKSGGRYGTVFNYPNACIGAGSEYMSYLYPSFYKLRSSVLDDYSFDELKKYEKLYITGPEYRDKEYCENMLRELSDAGVEIYIDMNRLPSDRSTGRNTILGVVAQPIVFNEQFPVLAMDNGSEFRLAVDRDRFTQWRTVYFTNLKNVTKTARYSKTRHLPYLGTSPNKNITFIGLNLVYFQGCGKNQDSQLYRFLDEVFGVDRSYLPERIRVPLDISFGENSIAISCENDGVMTSLANLDNFRSDRDTGKETFVMAGSGTVHITAVYSMLWQGLLVTVIGLILTMVSGWYIMCRYNIKGYGGVWVIKKDPFAAKGKPDAGKNAAGRVKDEASDADNSLEGVSFISEGYKELLVGVETDGKSGRTGHGSAEEDARGHSPDGAEGSGDIPEGTDEVLPGGDSEGAVMAGDVDFEFDIETDPDDDFDY